MLVLVLLVLLGVGGFLLVEELRAGDASPPTRESVLDAFNAHGLTCNAPGEGLGSDELASQVRLIPALVETDSGTLSQGEYRDMMNAVTAAQRIAADLPPDGTYRLTECSGSWVISEEREVYLVVLGLDGEPVSSDLEELGVPMETM